MIRLPFFHNSQDDYRLMLRIPSPSQSINTLCFTPDGRYLASGGDDETVKIWSLDKRSCCQTLEYSDTRWGQITCMSFIGEDGAWLAFGTGHGLIYVYGQAKGGLYRYNGGIQVSSISDPVESLTFDRPSNRLVVTSHFGHILAYGVTFFDAKVTFHQQWSKVLLKAIPRTATFANEGKEVLISLLNVGEIMTLASDSGTTIATKSVHWPIGNCTSNVAGNLILLQNLAKGFDLYKLPELIKTCSIETKTRVGLVKDVRFAENGSIAVGGSDSGKVYIMDLKLGAVVQELPHGKDWEAIQAVDTFSSSDSYLIASASGTGSNEPAICLWEKPTKLGVNRRRNGRRKMQWLIGLCIVVLAFLIYRVSLSWRAKVELHQYAMLEKAMQKELHAMFGPDGDLGSVVKGLKKTSEIMSQAQKLRTRRQTSSKVYPHDQW